MKANDYFEIDFFKDFVNLKSSEIKEVKKLKLILSIPAVKTKMEFMLF